MKTTYEVCDAFLNHKSASSKNCSSTGHKFYSYCTCMAQWITKRTVIINMTNYSNATAKHIKDILYYCLNAKYIKVICVYGVDINVCTLHRYLNKYDAKKYKKELLSKFGDGFIYDANEYLSNL